MNIYPIKIPKVVQSIFGKFKWSFTGSEKVIYITFDDGPIPDVTPWVLKTLSEYNASATFFCIGENVEKYPKIFQKILAEKHCIGNHTNNHLNGWKTSTKDYLNNIGKAEINFQSSVKGSTTTNYLPPTNLFRPPYGKIKPGQAKHLIKMNYKIIMWDVLSGDFDTTISKEKCLENVIKNVKNGSIIVFHDSIKAFKNLEYALPKTLEYFTDRGYVFKAI